MFLFLILTEVRIPKSKSSQSKSSNFLNVAPPQNQRFDADFFWGLHFSGERPDRICREGDRFDSGYLHKNQSERARAIERRFLPRSHSVSHSKYLEWFEISSATSTNQKGKEKQKVKAF